MLTITRDSDVLRGLVLLRANTPQSLVDLVLGSQIPLLPVNITSTIVGYTIPIFAPGWFLFGSTLLSGLLSC